MKNVNKAKFNSAKYILAAGFFALGGSAIGGTALAHEPTAAATTDGSVTYPVGFSDLNVSTIKGAKTLYLRIRYAAETLCENAASWGKKEGQACVRKAVDDAVTHVDLPLLTQYYELRVKGDKAALLQLAKAN